MSVKENLSGLPDEYQATVELINFEKLERFVSMIVNSMIQKFGQETVDSQIQRDDSNSPVSQILTHIIEVGGVKVISDNSLETSDVSVLTNVAVVVSFAMNIALAKELQKFDLFDKRNSFYYNMDSLQLLMDRIVYHVKAGDPDDRKHFEYFVNDMIKQNLFNKL